MKRQLALVMGLLAVMAAGAYAADYSHGIIREARFGHDGMNKCILLNESSKARAQHEYLAKVDEFFAAQRWLKMLELVPKSFRTSGVEASIAAQTEEVAAKKAVMEAAAQNALQLKALALRPDGTVALTQLTYRMVEDGTKDADVVMICRPRSV